MVCKRAWENVTLKKQRFFCCYWPNGKILTLILPFIHFPLLPPLYIGSFQLLSKARRKNSRLFFFFLFPILFVFTATCKRQKQRGKEQLERERELLNCWTEKKKKEGNSAKRNKVKGKGRENRGRKCCSKFFEIGAAQSLEGKVLHH